MDKLIVGSSNPAKIQMIQSALIPLNIAVQGTDGMGIALDIEEDGKTAQENARKKSLAYAAAIRQPVLSIDNALYIDGLPDHEQPGINTRKIDKHGGRASDEELLEYFSRIIERLGGKTTGRWEFAVCIADEKGNLFEKTIISPRQFISKPSKRVIKGYPLESIQIEPESGIYISEMTPDEQDRFWQNVIGKELCDFVSQALSQVSGK